MMEVRPFSIAVDDLALEDLRRRLGETRWPDAVAGAGWDYGSDLGYVRELCEYWRTGFDWRAQERKLNGFSHYKSVVGGLDLHFIRERGRGPVSDAAFVLSCPWRCVRAADGRCGHRARGDQAQSRPVARTP